MPQCKAWQRSALAQAGGHVVSPNSSDEITVARDNNHVYLILTTSNPSRTWQIPVPGTYLWSKDGSSGLQLRDLAGDGRECVIVISSDGASLGAYLRVFRFKDGALELISPPNAGGYDFAFEPNGKGEEIVSYGKWTEEKLANVSVLVWDGTKLMSDPERAKAIFQQWMASLSQEVTGGEPMTALLRVTRAKIVLTWLMENRDYYAALSLCDALLDAINNNYLTMPAARPQKEVESLTGAQRADLAQTERLQALSAVHMMLSQIYEKLGQLAKSQEERVAARNLDTTATSKVEQIFRESRRHN